MILDEIDLRIHGIVDIPRPIRGSIVVRVELLGELGLPPLRDLSFLPCHTDDRPF